MKLHTFKFLLPAFLFIFWGGLMATAGSSREELIRELDAVLARRTAIEQTKQQRIDSLKAQVRPGITTQRRTWLYNQIYKEYITFKFDSALTWATRAGELARATNNRLEMARNGVHRAMALASSGYCSQAVAILDTISMERYPELKQEYYSACEWTYGAWEEFGPVYAQEYHRRRQAYLDTLVAISPKGTAQYSYLQAESALSRHDYKHAIQLYNATLSAAPQTSHLYAKSAYAMATIYKTLGNIDRQEEFLIRAAISDQIAPVKENLALQELALFLKKQRGDVVHANAYLRYAIEDAVFFNSRLRMDGVASKFPQIVVDYQDRIKSQNTVLKRYAWAVTALACAFLVTLFLIIWQFRQLKRSRRAETEMNNELIELNRRLLRTNKFRDQYLTLFMELCATYIDKYNSYRSLVRLKLMAKQFDDLTRMASRSRSADAEAREMFFNFDFAFLKIYPDFVKEFNALLRPGTQIELRPNELLNTELRIFALIRMGVTDSAKIATLLSYSPQTIYNYRTSVRNRALNRETFETEVMRLCTVMPEDEKPETAAKPQQKGVSAEKNASESEI